EESVRRFAEQLLKDLKRGVLFPHDRTFAALAVVLGDWYTPFADEYLRGLAGLKAAEMPYGPRVAREVLSHRQAPAKVSWVGQPESRPGGDVLVEDYREFSKRYSTRAKNQEARRVARNGVR